MHGIPDAGSTDGSPASAPPDWPTPGTPLAGEEPTIELPVVTEAMLAAEPAALATEPATLATEPATLATEPATLATEPAMAAAERPVSSTTLAAAALSLALDKPARSRLLRVPALARRGPRAAPPHGSTALDDLLDGRAEPQLDTHAEHLHDEHLHDEHAGPVLDGPALDGEAGAKADPGAPAAGRGWMVGAGIAAAALLLTGAAVVLLSRDSGPGTARPSGWSAPVAPVAAPAPHTATAALDGRTSAGFDLIDGAKRVTVQAADLGDALYRVTTPESGAGLPRTEEQDGRIRLRLDGDTQAVDITLNAAVRWDLRVTGGAELSTIDLSAGRVGDVDLTGGASRIALRLPRPDGTLSVRMSGGVSLFDVRTADGTPVRVRVGKGAGQVTLDGKNHGGVSAGQTFTPASWGEAVDRVDVDATAGMSALTVAPY